MKKNFLLLLPLFLIFLSGCSGPSASEIGYIGLFISPAFVLFSLLIIPLSKISKNKRLFWKNVGLQYIILFIASIFLAIVSFSSMVSQGFISSNILHLFLIQIWSILAIPYIILFTLIFLVLLPKEYANYLPSLIVGLYCLSVLAMIITNSTFTAGLIFLPIAGWFISIPLATILIILIRIKKI